MPFIITKHFIFNLSLQSSYDFIEWSDSESEPEVIPVPWIPDFSKVGTLKDMLDQFEEEKVLCLLDLLNKKVEQVVSVCLGMNAKTLIRGLKFAKWKTRVKKVTVNTNTVFRVALTLNKNSSFRH